MALLLPAAICCTHLTSIQEPFCETAADACADWLTASCSCHAKVVPKVATPAAEARVQSKGFFELPVPAEELHRPEDRAIYCTLQAARDLNGYRPAFIVKNVALLLPKCITISGNLLRGEGQ